MTYDLSKFVDLSTVHNKLQDHFVIREIHPQVEEECVKLGQLMYDAYLDTVDYEGESLQDAVFEVSRTLTTAHYGATIPEACLVIEDSRDGSIIAAIITALTLSEGGQQCSAILYLMTAKKWQRKGFGKRLLMHVLQQQHAASTSHIYLSVNPLNVQARQLYEQIGFAH